VVLRRMQVLDYASGYCSGADAKADDPEAGDACESASHMAVSSTLIAS
jgi:hypothetical protein